jgi:integrase
VGLYKICTHKGRARDRCEHAWWGSFRGKRVSLPKWTNREIGSKAKADVALDELRAAIRDGTFDERGLDPPPDNSPVTFGKFAEVYKQRHVLAKGLALSSTIDYRLKPLIERFGDRPVAEIKTADIDDFVADLKQPRVVNGLKGRRLTPASINRTLGLLRHMLNWAVGREYLDRTPFRRGTEVLIRMELEDNKRRRRISESEEAALLAVASPHLRSMIIAALDTGMRRGEMLALPFGDIDWKRRMITLRGATTKSRRTRLVPMSTARLLAVLEWLRLDSASERKADDVPVFSNEAGEALKTFKKAWVVSGAQGTRRRPALAQGRLQGPLGRVPAALPRHQPALARSEARLRLKTGRARCSACAGARPAWSRVDPHDRAVRQSATGSVAGGR